MATVTSKIIEGIKTLYNLSYNIYYDHAPSSIDYPIITYMVVDSPKSNSMSGLTTPNEYSYCRVQFSVYCNEKQVATAYTAIAELQALYNYCTLSVGSSHFVCMKSIGDAYPIFDRDEKIYIFNQDYLVIVGS